MEKTLEDVQRSENVLWNGKSQKGLVFRYTFIAAFLSPILALILSFLPLIGSIIGFMTGFVFMAFLTLAVAGGLYYYVENTDYVVTDSNFYILSPVQGKQVSSASIKSVKTDIGGKLFGIDSNHGDITIELDEQLKFRNVENPDMVDEIIIKEFHLPE